MGALLLGYYTEDGRLHYAGRAGTGMTEKELKRLAGVLAPLQVSRMPLAEPPPRDSRFGSPLKLSRVHWVRPEIVVEVTYTSPGPKTTCSGRSLIRASEKISLQCRSCGRCRIHLGALLALALRRRPLEALPTPVPLSFSVLKPRTPKQFTFESLLLRPTPPSPAQGSEHRRDNQCANEREPNLLLDVHWVTCSAELGAVREATAIGRIASELLASHAEDSEKRVQPLLDQFEHALSACGALVAFLRQVDLLLQDGLGLAICEGASRISVALFREPAGRPAG